MRPIDADRALEIVRDQAIAHPNAYHLTNYATLILREAPTLTDLSKCLAFNSTADDKSQTNADRIRAMSDEELAKLIAENAYTGACNDFGIPHQGQCCHNCERCDAIIKWLKHPAE